MTILPQNNALGLAVAGLNHETGAPHQTLQVRLDIFSESIILTRYKDGSPQATYEIAPESLAAAFSGTRVSTGILPENCIYYAKERSELLAIFIPPHRRKLSVSGLMEDGPVIFDIPLPPLIFSGKGKNYSIYAVKQRPTSHDDRLYLAPLPNVYADGRVCRGNVAFPVCSAGTIHEAADLFLTSHFNNDLSAGKSRNIEGSIIHLWDELAGDYVEEYPLNDLIYYTTIRRLWGE